MSWNILALIDGDVVEVGEHRVDVLSVTGRKVIHLAEEDLVGLGHVVFGLGVGFGIEENGRSRHGRLGGLDVLGDIVPGEAGAVVLIFLGLIEVGIGNGLHDIVLIVEIDVLVLVFGNVVAFGIAGSIAVAGDPADVDGVELEVGAVVLVEGVEPVLDEGLHGIAVAAIVLVEDDGEADAILREIGVAVSRSDASVAARVLAVEELLELGIGDLASLEEFGIGFRRDGADDVRNGDDDADDDADDQEDLQPGSALEPFPKGDEIRLGLAILLDFSRAHKGYLRV